MVTETRDRRINADARMRNDGVKRLPHERDESPDAQDQKTRGIMRQAASDMEEGLVDTDLHGERGLEKAVTPTGGGQAKPQPDRESDMRERPASHRDTKGDR